MTEKAPYPLLWPARWVTPAELAREFPSAELDNAAAELAQIIERAPVGDPYESVTRAGAEKAARDCISMLESMGWARPK